MPLPVAHGLLGASIIAALVRKPAPNRFSIPFLIGAALANAADLDFLLVAAFHSKAWHRGFSHSIAFAVFIVLLLIVLMGRNQLRNAVAYGLAFASHALLDFVTTKSGDGVALLWPFSSDKFAMGWWGLSEAPSKLTPVEIVEALALEVLIFAPIFLGVFLLAPERRKTRLRLD